MKPRLKNIPRKFKPDLKKEIVISDFGKIALNQNEMISFITKSGKEYDVVAKEWGFYATPSVNERLLQTGFKTALVKNQFNKYYIMLVEKEKLNLFRDYLTETEQSVVEWLDERVKNSPECPICKANRFNTEFVVTREDKYAYTDNRKKEPAKYRECKSCGVMILNDTQDYEKIYSDGTYYSVNGVPTDFLKRRFKELLTFPEDKSDNLKRIKRIKSFLKTEPHFNTPGTKKVLDVGAGLGIFLYQFLDNSWEGTAVDPSPNACVHMKTVLDSVRVVNGFIEDIPPQNKFDLITINRVLEHVFNPFKMLNSIKNYLKDNGVLYLELPDVMSYYKDGHNNEAFGYGHYLVYSPTSLLLLTSKTGFELISMSREIEPSSKFTLYGFFRKK